MTTTIEIPKFWTFHRSCCGAMFGAQVADQSFGGSTSGPIIATKQQAWDQFYEGRRRDSNTARKRGDYVTGSENIDGLGEPHADECPART